MRTEEQENSKELHIVRDHLQGHHGSFLTYLFYAFVNADRDNFEILLPVIQKIIQKYKLRCTCEV